MRQPHDFFQTEVGIGLCHGKFLPVQQWFHKREFIPSVTTHERYLRAQLLGHGYRQRRQQTPPLA